MKKYGIFVHPGKELTTPRIDVCMCLLCSKNVTNVLGQLLDDYDIRPRFRR
jgi:hypothetical protein